MKIKTQYSFADGILLVALLLVGGFHEYISCFLGAAMSIWLLVKLAQQKQLRIRKDLLTSSVVAICLCYGLTCLWGIDRGMALIGFLKFLPLLLYLFCLQQEEQPGRVLELLPLFGAVMTILSAVGMQFATLKPLFSVAERLAGFFQYPNTFAVFLLVCELLLLKKPGKKIWDFAVLLVLILGFLYTGSRTAFLVALIANAAMVLSMSNKKIRIIALAAAGVVLVIGLLLALDPESVLRRYLAISFTESTFVGRLLYWVDALPLLLKYPFGMGYMGYYYIQQSIQTGVYAVVYIHNDFLQLLLDVGLIPAGLFIAAVAAWFFNKRIPAADKIIVGSICLHSLFDFNLQYISMFFLLLLLLSREKVDKVLVVKPRLPLKLSFCAAVLAGVYIGASLMLGHFGARALADTLYPYNTQNKLSILEKTEDLELANTLAEEILRQNTYFYAPYSIKAKYCYSQGDFSGVITNQRTTLTKTPFTHIEYETYCKMLITGIDLYQKAGDAHSAEICQKELIAVQAQLSANRTRLSTKGKMIVDQPTFELSQDIQDYIRKIGG